MSDRRAIPSLEHLRQREAVRALLGTYGHAQVIVALRNAAGEWRARLERGEAAADREALAGAIERDAAALLARESSPSLVPVINATGVVIHTNLGRAPISDRAVDRIREIATGYANLEYDLVRGRRGSRDAHAEHLLTRLTGAEAAVVVNNCAAAVLIALAALARGREVVISRGELVEIGGGFRVPDVLAQSGARLREVGTTNRTRLNDYALAIGPETAAIVRVHPSNFRMDGFVERAPLAGLVELARRFSIPVIEDLGSGFVSPDPSGVPLQQEPTVQASIAAGVSIVCFSGDKLFGGPQAGIIVGTQELLAPIRRHPLMRALRVDKLTYAALEATLLEHLTGRAYETVPVMRMIATPVHELERRAHAVAARLRDSGLDADVVEATSEIGGGSAPGAVLGTRCVSLGMNGLTADAIALRLRVAAPPVVARIEQQRVLLDLRTVDPRDDDRLVSAAVDVLREPAGWYANEES